VSSVTHNESREFYEDFSLAVGERDWLLPNPRHLQLRLLIRQLLAGRENMRIADIGCGAGVMTDYLTRYGTVTGVDFSSAAIEAAKLRVHTATFLVGGLERLPDEKFDLLTLFDVLEHIPANERPGLFAELGRRMHPNSLLFCSTPFPAFTRYRKERNDPTLQIIDEEVELPAVVAEAAAVDLQLRSFTTYDVFSGGPEFQAMVFTPTRSYLAPPSLTTRRFRLMCKITQRRLSILLRRGYYAARSARYRQWRTAYWFLATAPPQVDS
jgi:2-polyprenyl-3-methyl-5-hydroxy-6-metoxy-1,4-benzoquinol methylase